MSRPRLARLAMTAVGLSLAGLLAAPATSSARDLGVEGQVYEPIEEDMRVLMMRLLARQDWSERLTELEDSARSYTKNLPAYLLPRAETTETTWKDVGIVVTEDIYLPWVEWETGSVFEPQRKLAMEKGTYLNPIAKLPSGAIERLFVFDATDPDQLAVAKDLMAQNIPQLSFMLIAGDLGELSTEMNRPIYHPPPTMLEKFHIQAVPALVGFGRGQHQGHMAVTTLKLPFDASLVRRAWYGLPHEGYNPESLADVEPEAEASLSTPEASQHEAAQQLLGRLAQ